MNHSSGFVKFVSGSRRPGRRVLLFDEHIVTEAAGAAATAAFLQGASAYAGQNIVLLMTGANVPPEVLRRAVA